jgi:hypothetical protein
MHMFFLRIISHHCQDIWGMDIEIEDGDSLTTDPVSLEIRLSPDFQKAFLALRMGTLETLRGFKAKTLHYLATDQGICIKERKHKHLMTILTKYVRHMFALFGNSSTLTVQFTVTQQEVV